MTSMEPSRISPGGGLSRKMATLARFNTRPELLLRSELHRRGLRFRVQLQVPGNRRRTIDIAFPKVRVAVYVDGCFWHGCPDHGTKPKTNAEWWSWKFQRNWDRDRDTDALLTKAGWTVLRFWEHEDPVESATVVEELWRARTGRSQK